MSEVVKIWIIDDFVEKITELDTTIKNEELWYAGSITAEEARLHKENIQHLYEYIDYLKEFLANMI